jgi:hypothetical protein
MYRRTYIQECHNKCSFQQEAESLHQQSGLTFKEEDSKKCQTLSITLCGAETWTLWKADQKYLESLKCGFGEGWRRQLY